MPGYSEIPTDISHENDHCEDLCLCDYMSPAPDTNQHITTYTYISLLFKTETVSIGLFHSIHQSPYLLLKIQLILSVFLELWRCYDTKFWAKWLYRVLSCLVLCLILELDKFFSLTPDHKKAIIIL